MVRARLQIKRHPMMQQQMELGLKTSPIELRPRRTGPRASWWFQEMRRAVDISNLNRQPTHQTAIWVSPTISRHRTVAGSLTHQD
jgi:hypothetical protein